MITTTLSGVRHREIGRRWRSIGSHDHNSLPRASRQQAVPHDGLDFDNRGWKRDLHDDG